MGKLLLFMLSGIGMTLFAATSGLINPSGVIGGFLMAGFLIGSFACGFLWIAQKLGKVQYESMLPKVEAMENDLFKEDKVEKLVDYIDRRACESVISNNNEWLKINWYKLTDDEKQTWVGIRRGYLEKTLVAAHAHNSPSFIEAMQLADKAYSRNKKVA